jgi:predicted RNase H-like nuclease (RuvC/YqgF family)
MASSRLIPSKDTKGRRQPARKPQSRKVPIESQKQAARQVVKHMAAANAESEVNEVARLRARIHELETEVNQLKHKNLALQSKVDELRARLGDAPRYSRSR